MPELYVNVDHIATLREARKGFEPNPLNLVKLLESSTVAGITTHLREDRRHIQDKDIKELDDYLRSSRLGFTFEMAATEEIREICLNTSANMATIVPEKRTEVTTEGGLDVIRQSDYLKEFIKPLREAGKDVSLFINPALDQIMAAQELGANYVELHTGRYANLYLAYQINESQEEQARMENLLKIELEQIEQSVIYARGHGLTVNLGHGLSLDNLPKIMEIKDIKQYHIGHSLISSSLIYGFTETCNKYIELINESS